MTGETDDSRPGSSRWPLLAAGIATSIVLVEALLRVAGISMPPVPLYPGDREPVRDTTWDPYIGWKLPPSATIPETTADYSVVYHSNSLGFRASREFPPPAATEAGGERLVFLGDSFTFGSGVEETETFAAGVAAARPGSRSFNLGIGGFGIDQMWLTLVHYGLDLEPTRVVLAFIRNDLDRSLSAYRLGHVWQEKPLFLLADGELERMTPANRPGPLASWLRQDLRLTGLWRRLEGSLGRRWAVGHRWRLNRALFAAVRDTCAAAGVPLLVVHLPVNRRSPVPLFEREFAALGIDYLDLTPLLPADADALYFPVDRHFNAAGHRFAARAIRDALDAAPD